MCEEDEAAGPCNAILIGSAEEFLVLPTLIDHDSGILFPQLLDNSEEGIVDRVGVATDGVRQEARYWPGL